MCDLSQRAGLRDSPGQTTGDGLGEKRLPADWLSKLHVRRLLRLLQQIRHVPAGGGENQKPGGDFSLQERPLAKFLSHLPE